MAVLASAIFAGCIMPGPPFIVEEGEAYAQSFDDERKAFDAAKELGTVEAWDAFLSNYPKGFHADLARAYVKRLADQPADPEPPLHAVAPPQQFDYPMVAGSWGGIVRSGPGQDAAKVASLKEGEEVTLMGPPVPVTPNDYPWFKIAFRNGSVGYMWGGLLCSTGAERPDLFKLCTFTPYRDVSGSTRAPEIRVKRETARRSGGPSWCRSPGNDAERAICDDTELSSLDDVLNVAYRRAKFDSPDSIGEIEKEQRRWLGRRNLCGEDPDCIRRRYNEQIPFLEGFFGN